MGTPTDRSKSICRFGRWAILSPVVAWLTLVATTQCARAATTFAERAADAALLQSPLESSPPLDTLEAQLAADAADGALDDFSLATAALIAAGVHDPQSLTQRELRIDAWADELAHTGSVAGAPREQARAILAFLHRRVLTGGYDKDSSDLDRALAEGRFNCVSSLILFMTFCQRFAVPVTAMESPGHCYAVLMADHDRLEIEPTCLEGLDLSDSAQQRLARRIAAARQDDSDPGRRDDGDDRPPHRVLTGAALVAIVYYNRAIDLLRGGAFVEAVAANQMALRLDPSSSDARDNLLATLNNWALDLHQRGRDEQALVVLRHGLSAAPNHAKLRRNFVAISQQATPQPSAHASP